MWVVGLISGTSADGIDVALCEITGAPPQLQVRLQHTMPYAYPAEVRQQVLDVCTVERGRVDAVCQLHAELGALFGAAASRIIAEAAVDSITVDLIGSHGQTVWHMVQPDGAVSATLQLGEGAVIAERTGITTINNFRPRDIAARGQGAPLTSYVDWLLLRHPERWRAVQNIGGIANVTFLPPLSNRTSAPLAFDTGPGNVLLDNAVTILTGGEQTYDHDGALAAEGEINEAWLQSLLAHPYYSTQPPKTTGRELYSIGMATGLVAEAQARGLTPESIVATLCALTAASIADAYRRFAPAPISEVVVGGGGSRNPILLSMLRERLHPAHVMTHEDIGLDSDYKEALVFAVLAYETWHARPGNHAALTGARHATVLGQITPGKNFANLLRKTWCRDDVHRGTQSAQHGD